MAENKKSFVLYADLIKSIEHLTNEEKGILFNHLLEYVNDKNPILEDRLILTAWKPIELQLKRDLIKFEKSKDEKSLSGRVGNLKRWHVDLYNQFVSKELTIEQAEIIANNRKVSQSDKVQSQPIAKIAVNDNVNVTVNVNDTVNDIKRNSIDERKLKFASTLKPFVDVYGKELMNEFYSYWTEPNKSNTKFKQELEKTWSLERRLETWAKNDKNFKSKSNANTKQPISVEQRNAEYLAETIRTLREQTDGIGSREDSPNRSDDFTTFEIMQE